MDSPLLAFYHWQPPATPAVAEQRLLAAWGMARMGGTRQPVALMMSGADHFFAVTYDYERQVWFLRDNLHFRCPVPLCGSDAPGMDLPPAALAAFVRGAAAPLTVALVVTAPAAQVCEQALFAGACWIMLLDNNAAVILGSIRSPS